MLSCAVPPANAVQGAVDSEGQPVEAEFYRTFWGLQAYFSDPPRALQAGSWARLAAGAASQGTGAGRCSCTRVRGGKRHGACW